MTWNQPLTHDNNDMTTELIVTRGEAIARGLPRYFTGNPCKNGHIAERKTEQRTCVECTKMWEDIRSDKRRADITKTGSKRVFTGKPCRRGHIAERFISNNRCVVCMREDATALRLAKPEECRIYHRKWMESHRKKNLEKERARDREKYAANREKRRAYQVSYRKANPHKISEFNRNTKARRKGAEGTHSAKDIDKIILLQKNRCALCKGSIKDGYHVDHIIPISMGGPNWPRNIQVLCTTCNLRKSDIDPILYAQRLGMLL